MSTMDNEDIEGENFTWVNFKFKTIRIVGNAFTAHNSTIKAELLIGEETTEEDISIALEKIHFWFDQIVPNSIMFSRDNDYALSVMFDDEGNIKSDNLAMVFPDDPTDDFLLMILHSKLNALAGDTIAFGLVEIQSDTREMLTCTFTGYGEYCLPDMEEWVGERAFHDKPWWARNDGTTLDVIPDDKADLSEKPYLGVDLKFIEERFRRPANSAAIIIRPERFKPEVISGGKDDKSKN